MAVTQSKSACCQNQMTMNDWVTVDDIHFLFLHTDPHQAQNCKFWLIWDY